MSDALAPMKHLGGSWYYAARSTFLKPGLYFRAYRVLPFFSQIAWPELIEFPEQTVVIAKDQPQYRPLPAYRYQNDPTGKIICCWKLTWPARIKFLLSGKIWHQILTFNGALQPQLLMLDKPNMPLHDSKLPAPSSDLL